MSNKSQGVSHLKRDLCLSRNSSPSFLAFSSYLPPAPFSHPLFELFFLFNLVPDKMELAIPHLSPPPLSHLAFQSLITNLVPATASASKVESDSLTTILKTASKARTITDRLLLHLCSQPNEGLTLVLNRRDVSISLPYILKKLIRKPSPSPSFRSEPSPLQQFSSPPPRLEFFEAT